MTYVVGYDYYKSQLDKNPEKSLAPKRVKHCLTLSVCRIKPRPRAGFGKSGRAPRSGFKVLGVAYFLCARPQRAMRIRPYIRPPTALLQLVAEVVEYKCWEEMHL